MMTSKGHLFVLSGPSGAGKGTLRMRLFKKIDGLTYSISCTTREPRKGEHDGVDYRFIEKNDFRHRVKEGAFLEWAEVHGNLYGTLREDVEGVLKKGKDVVLEIDVQGALQVKKVFPEAITVFVMPPSEEVLEKRLRHRGTEAEEILQLRLKNAIGEMRKASKYDFIIVNDDIEKAVSSFVEVIRRYRAEIPLQEIRNRSDVK